jgi:hypothetical protein
MSNEPDYYENRRTQLQTELETLLGSRNVYFQPPESIKISYPAIIYERYDIKNIHANNAVYAGSCIYRITVIDSDPTSEIVSKLSRRYPMIKYNRHFVSEKLNHDVFTLYY